MKITNVTDKILKPTKVSVVVNIDRSPKTLTLNPGESIYVNGEYNSIMTQAMRVQKQRGLIDFIDENKPLDEIIHSHQESVLNAPKNDSVEVSSSVVENVEEGEKNINIFDLSLETLEAEVKTDVPVEAQKKRPGRPKGSFKVTKKVDGEVESKKE
jgi:hypothetical protein